MTGLQKHVSKDEQVKRGWIDEQGNINPLFKTIEQGASTSVWAAVAPELEGVGGRYLEDCGYSKLSDSVTIFKEFVGYTEYALNKDNAIKLWNLSLDWIKNPPK